MKKLLDSIESILSVVYSKIIENTKISDSHMAWYRIFLGIFFLSVFKPYSWLGEVPSGLYRPDILSIANLFNRLPCLLYFQITDYLRLTLLFLIILGFKARWSFLLIFIITIVNSSFSYSFGKIDHSILVSLIFLLFFFSNSGTKYAIVPDKEKPWQRWAIAIFSICLVFGLFTAGFQKALNWVDFDLTTSGIFHWFYNGYFNVNRDLLLSKYFFYTPNWLAEAMDYSAVLFELSGIFFLYYSRKSWHLYLIAAALFHLVNTLILNIPFTPHIIVYGVWLLSPALFRNRWMLVVLIIPFLLKGVYLGLSLWIFTLMVAFYSWRKNKYSLVREEINFN